MSIAKGSRTILVPPGYQAIVRKLVLIPGEVLYNYSVAAGTVPLEFLLSFLVEGGGVTENTNIPIQLLSGKNEFPLFFTVATDAEVEIALSVDQDIYLGGEGLDVSFQLIGQLILSDDRPNNMVVSTKRG